MYSPLRKLFAVIAALAVLLSSAAPAYAQTSTYFCTPSGILFGFFNGVQTTESDAKIKLERLQRLYGTTLPSTGEIIQYKNFYNYSKGLEDFVETFEQRLREQDALLEGRFELFLEAITGEGSWWSAIVNKISAATGILSALWDDLTALSLRNLTAILANPPTSINYAEHRLIIDNYAAEGKKMVFFAHSQGNLFANPAADYARSKTGASAVKVVHVAPASPTLRGLHVLADKDLVINSFRAFGSVPLVTHIIPGYLLRPAGLDGSNDFLGHSLLGIYLNSQLSTATTIQAYVNQALSSVTLPPQQPSTFTCDPEHIALDPQFELEYAARTWPGGPFPLSPAGDEKLIPGWISNGGASFITQQRRGYNDVEYTERLQISNKFTLIARDDINHYNPNGSLWFIQIHMSVVGATELFYPLKIVPSRRIQSRK